MDKGDVAWVPEARGKAVKVISALLKHLPATEQYRVIFIRRNIDEILASQRKMLIRRGEDPDKQDDAQMKVLFEKHVRGVEQWLAGRGNVRTLYVHYSDMLGDPRPQIERVNAFLGGKLDTAQMAEVVDPARVGITGCSYGGYFTLQSLATYPNTYSVGNAQCSLNDMMYEFNFGWSPFLAYLIGDTPTGNPAEYIKDSPTYNAYKIESPLLIFHGTMDFLFFEHLTNVHDQVKANGVDARFFRPIGYGHGIGGVTDPLTNRPVPNAGPMGQRFAFQLQLDWFRKHLGLTPSLAFDAAAARRYARLRQVSPLEGLAPRLTIPGLPAHLEVR